MTESRLSIALDENPDFQLVLDKYLKKLQEKQPPSYKVTKYLLRKLNASEKENEKLKASGIEDLIKILETYVTEEHRERLIDLILKHKGLAKTEKRDKIENARRDEVRTNPNSAEWFEYKKQLVGQEERDAAELIGAVEMLFFLNTVNPRTDKLTRLSALDPGEVVSLSKLIGVFTKDYKILDLFFRLYETQKQTALVENAIGSINSFYEKLIERYTPEEYRNYCNFILDHIDLATLASKNQEAIDYLKGPDVPFVGNFSRIYKSILISGLISNNMDRLRKREIFNIKSDLVDIYWSNKDGEPFILAKLEFAVKTNNEMQKKKQEGNNTSNPQVIENSIALTSILLPILAYAIESRKFDSFDQAKLKEQANRLLTSYPFFFKLYEEKDSKNCKVLIEYLKKLSDTK